MAVKIATKIQRVDQIYRKHKQDVHHSSLGKGQQSKLSLPTHEGCY